MEDLAVTGTITAVRAYAWARRTSTSELTMRMGIRIGSTYYYGDVATTQTYALYGGAADGCEWTVNPSTSNPWTVSEVNDLIGFVQHAGVNGRQLRVTQLYLEVDITP